MLVAAVGFGTLGVVSRFAGDAGISTVTFVAWRASLGAAILVTAALLLLRLGRMQPLRLVSIPRLHWLQISTVALLTVITNLALFAAFERTTIALVLIVFYTYPEMVAIAAVRVYGDRLTPTRVASLTLASIGMLMVVLAPALGQQGVDIDGVGLALGVAAALSQAVYALIAGRGYSSLSAGQAATTIAVLAAFGFLAIALLSGAGNALLEPFAADGAWVWIILAATIGLAIPTAAVIAGFRRMGPTRASIMMLFEPVVGVLLAALFIAERPSPLQLVGGLLVLAGSALVHVRRMPSPGGVGATTT
ncbi:MAG: DMT family transporter [Chloroflexota bacterium]